MKIIIEMPEQHPSWCSRCEGHHIDSCEEEDDIDDDEYEERMELLKRSSKFMRKDNS